LEKKKEFKEKLKLKRQISDFENYYGLIFQ